MAIPLNTLGVKISFAVETTAGQRPTTGYTHVPGFRNAPGADASPNTEDVSTFENVQYTSQMSLLKDFGGAQEYTAIMSQDFFDTWQGENGIVEKQEAGEAEGLRNWMCVDIPGLNKAVFIPVTVERLGMPPLDFNAAIEATVYVTYTGEPVWEEKPIYATAVA